MLMRPSFTERDSLGSREYVYSIASPILLLVRAFRYVSFIHVSKSRIVGYDCPGTQKRRFFAAI